MEFEISQEAFHEALKLAQGIVERRNTLPILSTVLIEAKPDGITIQATDGEIGIRKRCDGSVKGSGSIAVNARKLYEIVLLAPGESVRVKDISDQHVEVSSGKPKWRLPGMDPKEFPSIPGLDSEGGKGTFSLKIPPPTLGQLVERTLFAVSTDETRYNLSGVFVVGHEGMLRMVATDGHRLALIDRKVEGSMPDKGVILPRKGLTELRKLLEADGRQEQTITLLIDGSTAKVASGSVELFMRLVEGEFPDYRQVIPKPGKVSVAVGCGDLLATLRRVSIMSAERSRGVRLSFQSGTLEVRANNPDQGEASDDLAIDYRGEELSIGFNARYLMDVLGVLPESEGVELTVNDDVSPGVVRCVGDEHYTYVVMPMRLEPVA